MMRLISKKLIYTILTIFSICYMPYNGLTMEVNNNEYKQIESQELLSDYILNKYKVFEENDPPFLKLTIKNKTIYILGSIHPRNAQVLLPRAVFNKILEIAPKATLCTEHQYGFDILIKKLRNLEKNKKEWEMDELLNLSNSNFKEQYKIIWNEIKNDIIPKENNLRIEDIQFLEKAEGIMLLKCITKEKYGRFIPGFEESLRKLHWKNKGNEYLETIEESIKSIRNYDDDLLSFLDESFNTLMESIIMNASSPEEKEKFSIKKHKEASRSYRFDFVVLTPPAKKVKRSTIERNKNWVDNFLSGYLNKESNGDDVLFIVCGNAHLKLSAAIEGDEVLGSFLNGILNKIKGTHF